MTTTLTPDTGAPATGMPATGMPANDTPAETAAVLLIESLYEGSEAATEVLELDFNYRTKSRLRAKLVSGAEAGLFLPRGTILRGGQKLQARDGRIVEVRAAPEELIEARCASPVELARAAYHLGNRHVAVQVGSDASGDWLRIQADHVLEGMLAGLGAQLVKLNAPFEPEAGAYAHGHQHPGDGSGARIHMMAGR